MLIPTPGVMQNMTSHPQKINTPKSKEISLLVILQKKRGPSKNIYMLKKHRKKYVLQSKSIEKTKSEP
jgi:hypothetical protein